MTVCRYFLQGTCRFGDRCRFEHVQESNDNPNRHQNQQGRQHVPKTFFQQDSRYAGYSDRYSETYRAESIPSSRAYDRNYYNDHSNEYYDDGSRYSNQNKGYNKDYQRNYSANTQYSSNARYGTSNRQNQYRWSKEEYASKHLDDSYANDYEADFSSSTPKGAKSSFSFKVPESEIKRKTSLELTEQDQLATDIVKEDSKFWELGGLWPFSCYFPIPNKPGFPGFSDVSPEELRYSAYTAEQNNNFQAYTQAVQNLFEKVNKLRTELLVPTPQLINTLRRIWSGEDLCKSDEDLASIPYLHCGPVSNKTSASAFSERNAAAFFSFKAPSETDSVRSAAAAFSFKDLFEKKPVSTAAAAFSFKESQETKPFSAASAFSFKETTDAKPFSSAFGLKQLSDTKTAMAPTGGSEIYSPMEVLTDDEKEQFKASTFVLGKIPTKPPPQVFCM